MKRLAAIACTVFPLVLLKYSAHILCALYMAGFYCDDKEARFESTREV